MLSRLFIAAKQTLQCRYSVILSDNHILLRAMSHESPTASEFGILRPDITALPSWIEN